MTFAPTPVRVSVVGLGMVGEWLLRAIEQRRDRLLKTYAIDFRVVALASRRDGFVYDEQGITIADALALRRAGGSIADLDRGDLWPTALDGLEACHDESAHAVRHQAEDRHLGRAACWPSRARGQWRHA